MVSNFGEQFTERLDEITKLTKPVDGLRMSRTLAHVQLHPRGGAFLLEGMVTGSSEPQAPTQEGQKATFSRMLQLVICSSSPHPTFPSFTRTMALAPEGDFSDKLEVFIPEGGTTSRDTPPDNTTSVLRSSLSLPDALIRHSLDRQLWPEIDDTARTLSLTKVAGVMAAVHMGIAIDTANIVSETGLMVFKTLPLPRF